MSVSCCAAPLAITAPQARPAVEASGRHRRSASTAVRIGRAVDVIARLGSLVTLAALLVLAGAVGGLVDGVPASPSATVTATFGSGH